MDEPPFTYVDANMAESAAHGVEKHQIAGSKLLALDGLCCRCLVGRSSWQDPAHRLLKHHAHKSAAIEPTFGRIASVAVGHTQETHGGNDETGCSFTDHVSGFGPL